MHREHEIRWRKIERKDTDESGREKGKTRNEKELLYILIWNSPREDREEENNRRKYRERGERKREWDSSSCNRSAVAAQNATTTWSQCNKALRIINRLTNSPISKTSSLIFSLQFALFSMLFISRWWKTLRTILESGFIVWHDSLAEFCVCATYTWFNLLSRHDSNSQISCSMLCSFFYQRWILWKGRFFETIDRHDNSVDHCVVFGLLFAPSTAI